MNNNVAVLIPCYNEENTITDVVRGFRQYLPTATIYVYDNNSRDNTAALANEAGAVVVREYNQGKGNVIRSMFEQIEADVYVLVDGDNTYPAESVEELISPILNEGCDMVVGDRLSSTYFEENKRPMHNSGNRLVRYLINKLFKSNINDVLSGYRAFSRNFVKNFPVLTDGFEIETEMTIHALDKKFRIKEIPIQYKDRPANSVSKLNTYTDGYKVLRTIAVLCRDYRPLLFFSVISFSLFIVGVMIFMPVLMEYLQTGLVPRFPTLIVACVLWIISVLLLLVGIILGAIAKNNRRMYELMRISNRHNSIK